MNKKLYLGVRVEVANRYMIKDLQYNTTFSFDQGDLQRLIDRGIIKKF